MKKSQVVEIVNKQGRIAKASYGSFVDKYEEQGWRLADEAELPTHDGEDLGDVFITADSVGGDTSIDDKASTGTSVSINNYSQED